MLKSWPRGSVLGGWGGAARGGSVGDGFQSQAKTRRPQDRRLGPLRRTMEEQPCPSGSRSGIHVARNKPRTYVGKIAQARRLSKNSLSKFISPSHQMACGFQA